MVKALINQEFEKIKIFEGFDLIRIRVPMDGNCFFHSILKAYFKPYIVGKIDGETFNRKEFIKNLRKDLAKKLGSRVEPRNKNSKTYYQTLSKGELENISKDIPAYSLKNMQKELNSSSAVSNIYNEFISNELDIDIYILDAEKKDVYMTGTDEELLYKNRKSVVILYMPGHYELVGLMNSNDEVETLFSSNSELIQKIRQRMKELVKS